MVLRPDLLGARGDEVEVSWTADDVMLYALAVGAGQDDPTAELAFTTENTADAHAPLVLPTFANILTRRAAVPFGDHDRSKVVHAEQAFRVAGPLPAQGRARVVAEVGAVESTRGGLLVRTDAEAVDADTGAPLASSRQTVMLRGEPGGEPAARVPSAIPDRAPDREVTVRTLPGQALLYRLTGDRNPLHSDPAFAARGGFDRPILHGMCTYGFAGRVLLAEVAGGDPARLVAMDARFTRPVLPGDELVVAIWPDDTGAHFRVLRDGEPVLDRGRIETAGT